MKPFIPREKLSKKAKRKLDRAKRQTWAVNPVTRTGESAKTYNRKKKRYRTDDDGAASLFACCNCNQIYSELC